MLGLVEGSDGDFRVIVVVVSLFVAFRSFLESFFDGPFFGPFLAVQFLRSPSSSFNFLFCATFLFVCFYV